jgi:hypothetical protein
MGVSYHPNEYIEQDDCYILRIISDTYGVFDFIIDKDDYKRVKEHQWAISKVQYKDTVRYYGMKSRVGLLHRYVLDYSGELFIDHKDGNTLNTRKENLQYCNNQENLRKAKKGRNNTSGRTGVYWSDKDNKWMAGITVNAHFKNLGYYTLIDDAIKARERAELKYFGTFTPIDQ